MGKEKELKDMRDICKSLEIDGRDIQEITKTLVKAGYGNVKQAVKEFATELKKPHYRCGGLMVLEDEDLDDLITKLYSKVE